MGSDWEELRAKVMARPGAKEQVERLRREMEKRYNRPWWRLVRWWDKKREERS